MFIISRVFEVKYNEHLFLNVTCSANGVGVLLNMCVMKLSAERAIDNIGEMCSQIPLHMQENMFKLTKLTSLLSLRLNCRRKYAVFVFSNYNCDHICKKVIEGQI